MDAPSDEMLAAGLAGNALALELLRMLSANGTLSDDAVVTLLMGANLSLRRIAAAAPHPVLDAAQALLERETAAFGRRTPAANQF